MDQRTAASPPPNCIRAFIHRTGKGKPGRSYNPYLDLPEDERLRQIGEILHQAARLYWRQERLAGRTDPASPTGNPAAHDITDLTTDETEKNILRCLSQLLSASPGQIGRKVGIAHTTLVRKLARLKAAGLVVVTGKTKRVRYELAGPGQRN